jgi:hypothetical protein
VCEALDYVIDGLNLRVRKAEEIIRAQERLMQAMYDGDFEAGWPRDSQELIRRYMDDYRVSLYADGSF